jgi:hypothetical protein
MRGRLVQVFMVQFTQQGIRQAFAPVTDMESSVRTFRHPIAQLLFIFPQFAVVQEMKYRASRFFAPTRLPGRK